MQGEGGDMAERKRSPADFRLVEEREAWRAIVGQSVGQGPARLAHRVLGHKAAFEATPILIDGVLFLSTPYDHVFALNAATGDKLWEFDPKLELPYGASEVTSRGVSAWRDPSAKPHQPCALRIFIGTLDARLIALDGANGKPCADFGANGEIDLTANVKLRDPGDYQVTSAPAIYNDLVITGSSSGDNRAVTTERGIVRAFDVRSGKLVCTWDPIAPWATNESAHWRRQRLVHHFR